jgi:hypothetical protein
LFHGLDPALDEQAALVVGSFYPGAAARRDGAVADRPGACAVGRDLAEALRTIAADVGDGR